MRKGVYLYRYMDSWGCFNEPQVPPKETFYSKLTDEHIRKNDYTHGKMAWEAFACRNLRDYHYLYDRTDVLLLADIFESDRKTCLKQYGLDPAHYCTSPGLSWNALLKKTGVELELLIDYDMNLFIKKGMRDGVCMASKRYAKASNRKVHSYDSSKSSTYILCLDTNNLYGWAMSQSLPI